MKRFLISTIALGALASGALSGIDSPHKEAFKRFQTLVGTWEGKAGESGDGMEAKVVYKLTAGGTVLVEYLFEGTDHEMVTMYHMDNNSLVCTHYCAAGNQPRLVLKPGKEKDVYTFAYVSATNMHQNDPHMHGVTYKFLDADHITSDWQGFVNGKPGMAAHFDLHRVKDKS